jgi:hypothetical protein
MGRRKTLPNDTKKNKPKIHKHKGSGLEYLSGASQVLFETGVTMPRADFDEVKDAANFIEYLDKAAQDTANRDYDWRYACSTGQLRRKKTRADLVANARTERRRAKQLGEARKIESAEQKKTSLKSYVFSSAFTVMVVMAAVGIGSAVMSAYHTSSFLHEGGKPVWASLITGVMLILFSGTSFTAARYFFREKGAVCAFGVLFVVTGLAVIAYSMFSTLTVNFNQFKWKDDETASAAVADSETLSAHTYIMEETRSMLEEVSGEIARLETETDYWRERTWRRYDEFNALLTEAKKRRETLRVELARLEAERPVIMEQASVSRDTVYSFLGRLFNAEEDVMRFFVYVVPACLYDILAPFALSVVLLLADKRKEKALASGAAA